MSDTDLEEFPPLIAEDKAPDEFYFESDSYELLQNIDYKNLVRSLVQLEAQKIQAIKDLEILEESKKKILENPLAFAHSLQNGERFDLPNPIRIHQVPYVQWSKYFGHFGDYDRRNTRLVSKETQPNTELKPCDKVSDIKTERLPRNQWTADEQRRLEELLFKYPDERVSAYRWQKISKELGTRTVTQVQSRVQKYFLFLKNNGLPIPGKDPKSTNKLYTRYTTKNKLFQDTNSSFVKAFNFEPQRKEEPKLPKVYEHCQASANAQDEVDISDEEDIAEDLRDTEEYQDLLWLKRVKKIKQREIETGVILHYGHKCNCCSENPIKNTRLFCVDCPKVPGIDLCCRCAEHFKGEEQGHLSTHKLKPIKSFSLSEACSNPCSE